MAHHNDHSRVLRRLTHLERLEGRALVDVELLLALVGDLQKVFLKSRLKLNRLHLPR